MINRGKVVLIGAGPGDPGLLTVKGQLLLSQADTVVFDRLVGPGILSRIPATAKRIDVGKQAGHHPVPQERINEILLEEAQKGRLVVRLKGGDPFVFGRGGEELELLAEHQIPWEVVPGITSAIAAPAYAGIPVTHRGVASSLHIITGHGKHPDDTPDYPALAALKGTLVFLMGVSALPELCRGLLEAGMPAGTPAAVVENGTSSLQRNISSTLEQLPKAAAAAAVHSPAVIVVGQVCALADRFRWADSRPLDGVRVLVTRPRERAQEFSQKLAGLGAEVVEAPCIQTVERPLSPKGQEQLAHLSRYSWLAFTSAAGVSAFFHRLMECGLDARALHGCRIAAIGPATASALKEHGIHADLIPDRYDSSSLAECLCLRCGKGDQLLLPRAAEGSRELTDLLSLHRVPFTELPLYDTQLITDHSLSFYPLIGKKPCFAAFTSASTVRGFAASLQELPSEGFYALCIGEPTAREARRLGFSCIVAKEATIDSMVERLCSFVSDGKTENASL